MPMWRGVSVSWRPWGPPRLRWWLMPSAVAGFRRLCPTEAAPGVEVFPGVGHLQARLLEEVLAIGRDEHPVVLGHGAPHPVDVSAFVRRADRLAVLLLELAHDIRDVDELGLVQPREVHAHLDEVVPGLGLDLGRVLGLLRAHVRDVVDLELDAGVPGEALADLGQLLVRGGGEVVPAEVRDLPLLAAGRRNPRGENAGEASSGCRQEAAAADRPPGPPPSCRY